MTVRLKMYNSDETFLEYFTGNDGKHWWRVYTTDRDVIASSHQGWVDKEQCKYNAEYLITSEWDIQK